MKLYNVFHKLSMISSTPFSVLECEYDREGRIISPNRYMEELVSDFGDAHLPSMWELFPESFSRDLMDSYVSSMQKERISIRSLRVRERPANYLCFESPSDLGESITFIALPFNKASIVRLLRLFAQFEGYYNSNPDIVISVSNSWEILDINTAGFRKLGFSSKEDALAVSFEELFVLSYEAREYLINEIKKGNSITEFELLLKTNNSSHLSGLSSVFSLEDPGDEPRTIYFHIKDMSLQTQAFAGQLQMNMELSELNAELKRAYSSMLSQEKMAALGLLAAGMAHEINNPLGFIFNNVNVLMNHVKDLKSFVESVRQHYTEEPGALNLSDISSLDGRLDLDYIFDDIQEIQEENLEGIERIKVLLGSLRSFAQKDQTGRFGPFDLNRAVKETLMVTKNEHKYEVRIEEVYGDIEQFYCIGAEINQVLLNLVMNAIEAVLSVPGLRDPFIRIETSQDERYSYVKVSDNGPGIEKPELRKIFDPFYTTKPIGTGSGLGLTLTQDIIVHKHKGKIELLDSEKGACFLVSIPRSIHEP